MLFSEKFYSHKGNVADKWEGYMDIYDEILKPIKNDCKSILEIGVNNGGSLEIFAEYFSNANIITGIDIDEKCSQIKFKDPRIKVFIGNANDMEIKSQIFILYRFFDLIIDDGSHHSKDIIKTFINLIDLMNDGGTYIIEDLCCSYWEEFGGGVKSDNSAMYFFKNLSDIINIEHWRSKYTIIEYLQDNGFKGFSEIGLEKLSRLKSISFYNSMCVLKFNSNSHKSTIGKRLTRGSKYNISHPKNGQSILEVGMDQSNNPLNNKTIK